MASQTIPGPPRPALVGRLMGMRRGIFKDPPEDFKTELFGLFALLCFSVLANLAHMVFQVYFSKTRRIDIWVFKRDKGFTVDYILSNVRIIIPATHLPMLLVTILNVVGIHEMTINQSFLGARLFFGTLPFIAMFSTALTWLVGCGLLQTYLSVARAEGEDVVSPRTMNTIFVAGAVFLGLSSVAFIASSEPLALAWVNSFERVIKALSALVEADPTSPRYPLLLPELTEASAEYSVRNRNNNRMFVCQYIFVSAFNLGVCLTFIKAYQIIHILRKLAVVKFERLSQRTVVATNEGNRGGETSSQTAVDSQELRLDEELLEMPTGWRSRLDIYWPSNTTLNMISRQYPGDANKQMLINSIKEIKKVIVELIGIFFTIHVTALVFTAMMIGIAVLRAQGRLNTLEWKYTRIMYADWIWFFGVVTTICPCLLMFNIWKNMRVKAADVNGDGRLSWQQGKVEDVDKVAPGIYDIPLNVHNAPSLEEVK